MSSKILKFDKPSSLSITDEWNILTTADQKNISDVSTRDDQKDISDVSTRDDQKDVLYVMVVEMIRRMYCMLSWLSVSIDAYILTILCTGVYHIQTYRWRMGGLS